MKILFLDTSNNEILVAIYNDGNITKKSVDVKNDIAEKLHVILKETIEEADVDKKSFDKFIVTVGPGSFTGIRLAVATIKTFAWAINKKVIPISSMELIATTNVKTEFVAPLIIERNGFVYGGIYDKKLEVVINPSRLKLVEFLNNVDYKGSATIVSSDDLEIDMAKTDIVLEKIFNKYKNHEGFDPHGIKPVYLKESSAEEAMNNDKRS